MYPTLLVDFLRYRGRDAQHINLSYHVCFLIFWRMQLASSSMASSLLPTVTLHPNKLHLCLVKVGSWKPFSLARGCRRVDQTVGPAARQIIGSCLIGPRAEDAAQTQHAGLVAVPGRPI
jgi:hypothetical protein